MEAIEIQKSFPGVKALDGVSLKIRAGRLLALLGENGAGKSTLMNILSGVFRPDQGCLWVDYSKPLTFDSPKAAQNFGVGIVHQELNLIPGLSVAENIWLGREPKNAFGMIDYTRLYSETERILARLDLDVEPTALVGSLRVGQQQLIEIGKALSANARILILDEPTSSLSSHEVCTLYRVIDDLKRSGVGLVYITHKFEELSHICEDVVVMRDGRVVGQALLSELSRTEIVKMMAGREPKELFQRTFGSAGNELLSAENLTLPGDGLGRPFLVNNVSLQVRKGEVLGIFGLVGAGRTELLEILFGLHPVAAKGRITIEGKEARFESPADAIEAGLGFAPEDRKRDGLVLPMSVISNACLASLGESTIAGFLNHAKASDRLKPVLDRFRVKTPSLDQLIVNLSGGNQQKVILAKWLATNPSLLLLDEPTRGIDVNAKREIYAFIDELARSGLGLIVVSSELPEILTLSDRILVMCEGRATAEFRSHEATPERILHAALPNTGTSKLS